MSLKKYTQIFQESLEGVDTTLIPGKYLKPKYNYHRVSAPVSKAKRAGFKRGLDFGCGSVGSPIIGRLYGLEITGLDIPYGLDRSKEGERTRGGIKEDQLMNKTSIHLGPQQNLQEMGYKIIIRDTTVFPWEEFSENEFDFVMAYYALSKEWVSHADTLDFDGEQYKQRVQELIKLTRKKGKWYIHPQPHMVSLRKYFDLFAAKKIKIERWW